MNKRHQKILNGINSVPQEMTVRRADRSPTNPNRWILTLSCGHETWVTQKSKPTRMKAYCNTCKVPL